MVLCRCMARGQGALCRAEALQSPLVRLALACMFNSLTNRRLMAPACPPKSRPLKSHPPKSRPPPRTLTPPRYTAMLRAPRALYLRVDGQLAPPPAPGVLLAGHAVAVGVQRPEVPSVGRVLELEHALGGKRWGGRTRGGGELGGRETDAVGRRGDRIVNPAVRLRHTVRRAPGRC